MSNSKTATVLQQALTDSYANLIESQRFHWNIDGADFYGWHKLAEQIYDEQFTAIDEIAERLRALDKKVSISPEIIAKTTSVKFGDAPKDFLAAQEVAVGIFRKLQQTSGDEGDTATEDLANNRLAAHDKKYLDDKNADEKQQIMPKQKKPSQKDVEAAVRTLLLWTGDDPDREGLLDTPRRVANAYKEFFGGYGQDAKKILSRTFEESSGYDEIITLKNVPFESHCEHHMVPFTGKVHIGYLPNKRVVGISKLARIVDVFAKRLQIQEKLTAEIATTINEVLQPKGVAVIIEATHQCMTTRGVHKDGVVMQTSKMLGRFRSDERTRNEFMKLIKG